MSCSNCCLLTCIQVSQEAGQVAWYSHLFQNFPQFVVIHTVKGFSTVDEAEVDVLLEFSCFFYDSVDVGSLISGSFAFYKSSWYIWKFSIHVLYSLPCRILSITCICLYFSGDFFVVNCIWVLPLNWNVLNHLHLMHLLIQLDINLLSCCLFSLCPI